MTYIMNRLKQIRERILIGKEQRPRLQRLGDKSMIERITRDPKITREERELANQTQTWLRMTTLADLVAVGGKDRDRNTEKK